MVMRDAARTLASYGRSGDNMLVHVSRKELEGIRALTGRDFTRNPDTGLPEAFNFSSLIPAAAGIAGTVLSGGNPLVGAAASGLAGAGTAAARGASAEQALTQGLISGATTYAGGQILSGLGDAAGAVGSTGVSTPVSDPGFMGQVAAAPTSVAPVATSAAAPGFEIPGAAADMGSFGMSAPSPPPVSAGTAQTMGDRAAAFGTRLSNIASNPGAAASKLGENIANNKFSALIAGGGLLSQAGDMMGGQPAIPGQEPYDANRYPEQFPTNPRRFTAPPAGYRAGAGPEFRYFAKGGLASMRSEDGYTANLMNEAKAALLGEHPRPREALERFRESFGDDALALLRDRLTGGRVRGAGSGMDDLVPGTIEGRQKVRLADGEFVIPSDVVSGLGDGSTEHGVRRLHGLMDKVRQERTGKKAQPKSIGGRITL
jgi:hypothetical protein